MIKRKDKDPETHQIAKTKSTTNIGTVPKEKKTMTDKIAINKETESSIVSTRKVEIIGGIMIAIAIETTIGETDKTEISIEKEIVEDREMEETTTGRKKKK